MDLYTSIPMTYSYEWVTHALFRSTVKCNNNNNNHHIIGRNGTYVQNIHIKFIFTALSYQASAEQFNSKSYSEKSFYAWLA